MNVVQNTIFSKNEEADIIKQQMNWNGEELEQWALAAKQKEEDALALEKYQRQDEKKIKELELQLQKVTKEVQAKKAELNNEVTETQAAQIELDKTAEDFRLLHQERQDLVRQWQEAIEAMQRRDQAIQDAADKFAKGKAKVAQKSEEIAEKNKFLDIENQSNIELERKIAANERHIAKVKNDKVAQVRMLDGLRDEVDVIKNTVAKTSTDLSKLKSEIANAKVEIEQRTKRLAQMQQENAETKDRLAHEFQHTDDLVRRAKQLEEIHKMEEKKAKQKDKELADLKDTQFKQSQELFKLRQGETNLMAEISGAQTANRNMDSKISRLDADAQKQRQLVYTADFKIQQMERKVARAQGERTEQEKKELLAKIEELQGLLDHQTAQHKMLTQQTKKVSEEVREQKRQLAAVDAEVAALEKKIEALNLENDSLVIDHKKKTAMVEELQVKHDMLKLDVTKLRNTLNARADEVFGLENRKTQLQHSMEERMHEIGVHREVLQASLKVAEEERHHAHKQLSDRVLKLDKIKKKYELLLAKFAPSHDEEQKSEAFFLIQAAQEKQELERQGDDLDAQILKAEKEVRALENTLAMLGKRNTNYRTSFHKVDAKDPDLLSKKELENQLRAAMDRAKFKRSEIKELQTEMVTMQRSTESLANEKLKLQKRIKDLELRREQFEAEADEERAKIARLEEETQRLAQRLRTDRGADPAQPTVEELDFDLQELREQNKSALFLISKIAQQPQNSDVALTLENLLAQNGLIAPAQGTPHEPRRPGSGGRMGGGRRSLTPSAQR
eukprot:TRINITY_DN15701_c0_g1_i2.p1 TRINITY_DN15701_c0_g1~~TRINITY_DN15701_c0_g1_i2.p1  ORF type:complete len:789 (-),score=351.97 TRINITY_DN15701_c0_g1_i2:152-2518(-)